MFSVNFPRLERLSWEQKRWSLEAGELKTWVVVQGDVLLSQWEIHQLGNP